MLYMILPMNNEQEKEDVYDQINRQLEINRDKILFRLLLTDNIGGAKPIINGCKHNLFLFADTREYIPRFHIENLYGTGSPIILFNEDFKVCNLMIDVLNTQMKGNSDYKHGRISVEFANNLDEIDNIYNSHPQFGICIHNALRIQIPNIRIDFNMN